MSSIYIHLLSDCQFLASILICYVNVSIFGEKILSSTEQILSCFHIMILFDSLTYVSCCGFTISRKGGRAAKLEGSDHVPVFVTLKDIPDIQLHSTPPLSARYMPEIRGSQQTIGM